LNGNRADLWQDQAILRIMECLLEHSLWKVDAPSTFVVRVTPRHRSTIVQPRGVNPPVQFEGEQLALSP